jgi:hypothetical protein
MAFADNGGLLPQILRDGHFYLRDRQPLFNTLRPLLSTMAAA